MRVRGLVLLTIFLIITKPSLCQEKNKGAAIKKIFSVLAEKDEEGFLNLFPDVATMKTFMLKALNKEGATKNAEEIKTFVAALEDSTMQIDLREDYFKYIRMGEDNGVDWSRATFISFTADSVQVEQSGIKTSMLKGKIYFTVDTAKFFLAYDEVIWFDNTGWYGVSIDRVDARSKENNDDGYVWDGRIVDTTLMIMDSVVAATIADSAMTVIAEAMPAGKNKSNKKSEKNKSTKSKLQTPARKPEQ
jgi:hypothetical protein